MSSSIKSVDDSERVKVTVVVSPFANAAAPAVIAIVGTVVSITIALLAAKEPEAPGDARVRVAALPAASLIVPLFNDSAEVEVKSRSLEVSPA